MNFKSYIFFIAICLVSANAQSNDFNLCDKALTKPTYLSQVGNAATKAKEEICSSTNQQERYQAFYTFNQNIKGWFTPYGGFEKNKSMIGTINTYLLKNTPVQISNSPNDYLMVGTQIFKPKSDNKCRQVSGAISCSSVTYEFQDLYTEIHKLYVAPDIYNTVTNLQQLQKEWEPFLEQMKGQTWLELLVNRQAYKNTTNDFSSPPASQWIVLHPTLLVENISSAVDGENTEQAIGLEIIGMNWWQQDKWYVPSGVSALAVYADRSSVEDFGYGVALHFLSDYSLGYTNHDGKNGFFVSIDVIKLFQDKKKVFDSYKEAFKK